MFVTKVALNVFLMFSFCLQLSNAIEPFLQTGGSTEIGDGDTEVSQSVKGKYHPQPSIGLMKNQSAESGWGLRASASPDEVAGMSIILTEKEQANIHAALNRALVHIAR